MSPELVVTGSSCPVCGDGFEVEPRRCERCDTPHHEECWEYVPGCAVFGCADAAASALSTESWPATHVLVLRGMRWITAATMSLQGVVLSFVLVILSMAATGDAPPLVLLLLFGATVVSTLVSMYGAFRVKWAVQRSEAMAFLKETEAHGDRRLSRAIAERAGRTLPAPPSIAALAVSAVVLFPLLKGELLAWWASGGAPAALLPLLPLVVVVTTALYGALKLPARWVGYQRILSNRLNAALEASAPRKELPGA